MESNRVSAIAAGWLIQSRQMPAEAEVLVCGRWVRLTDDATYVEVANASA